MDITVTVKEVKSIPTTTRFGLKEKYVLVSTAGHEYGFGFKNPMAPPGSTITFDGTPNKYRDYDARTIRAASGVTTAVPDEGAEKVPEYPEPIRPSRPRSSFPIDPLDGQRSIIRQNAVTNAREIVKDWAVLSEEEDSIKKGDAGLDAYVNRIVQVARRIELYTAGDEDIAMATTAPGEEKTE